MRRYLSNRSNLVVARAAKLCAEAPDQDAEGELTAAFHRFLVDPVKTDPGCMAKLAIVTALRALDAPDPDVFRVGLRHVQPEPTWGGKADTAAPLRAACALGLVEVGVDGVLDELAAAPEPAAELDGAGVCLNGPRLMVVLGRTSPPALLPGGFHGKKRPGPAGWGGGQDVD